MLSAAHTYGTVYGNIASLHSGQVRWQEVQSCYKTMATFLDSMFAIACIWQVPEEPAFLLDGGPAVALARGVRFTTSKHTYTYIYIYGRQLDEAIGGAHGYTLSNLTAGARS